MTHSKGNASAKERPGTNLEYEKEHYRKRGLRVKKGPAKGHIDPERDPDALLMEDSIDEDEESRTEKQPTEAFNSMAEIASCSYEARKVTHTKDTHLKIHSENCIM